ncbi:MAG: DUF1207 domain-containing protein [Planctomycetaceae bacterium]|nr:DUF1207 domain-containing protein [Planctomycetaceae bacterium]
MGNCYDSPSIKDVLPLNQTTILIDRFNIKMTRDSFLGFLFLFLTGSLLCAGEPVLKYHNGNQRNFNNIRFLGQTIDQAIGQNDQTTETIPPLWFDSHSDVSISRIPSISVSDSVTMQTRENQPWTWQLFPASLIYPSYLAGVNESRLGSVWNHDKDLGWIWDITLGGRAPIVRYGNRSVLFPEGFQMDFEGSVHLRLDLENQMDMDAQDFRFGIPFSYGNKIWQVRTGYYHVSSHMGDERILRLQNQGIDPQRLNYVREALILGFSYRLRPSIKLYAEADYAFWLGERTSPWHFQFGAEWSSLYPTNEFWGKPFAAVNIMLLQERQYDGNITIQAGWQWRGTHNQLLRFGVQYFGGVSEQYEHLSKREHKIGIGLWYDF